jgi:hypothetical protein
MTIQMGPLGLLGLDKTSNMALTERLDQKVRIA